MRTITEKVVEKVHGNIQENFVFIAWKVKHDEPWNSFTRQQLPTFACADVFEQQKWISFRVGLNFKWYWILILYLNKVTTNAKIKARIKELF